MARRKSGKIVSTTEIDVDGIPVRVVRKRVSRMTLRIDEKDACVIASVPVLIPDFEVVRMCRAKRAWIENAIARTLASPAHKAANATKAELKEYRAIVSACVPALVEAWEPIMGVKAGELTYRNMKSRWGSCQPSTGRICINIRLALYPPECLEYVVVHELCHLLHANHGPAFHAEMDRLMPDWKARRKKLQS